MSVLSSSPRNRLLPHIVQVYVSRNSVDMTLAQASSFFQADISQGWNLLWEEEAEREGEHGNFNLILVTILSITLPGLPAHRDSGGTVSIAIMRCRKITIAAINGHAVSSIDMSIF